MDKVTYSRSKDFEREHSRKLLSYFKRITLERFLDNSICKIVNPIDTLIYKGNALSAKMYPKTPKDKEQMS